MGFILFVFFCFIFEIFLIYFKIVLKLLRSQWPQSLAPPASSCRMLELQACTPISVYVVLETDPRPLYILGKHFDNKPASYPLIIDRWLLYKWSVSVETSPPFHLLLFDI